MNKRTLTCYEVAWNMHISGLLSSYLFLQHLVSTPALLV